MHFLLIGASGRTGRLVLSDALERGHTVTALVRNPSSIPQHSSLTTITGTPTSATDISTAITSSLTLPSAVIVTLAAPRATDSPFSKPIVPPRFMADCLSNVRSAMKQQGIKRLVIMSALGSGESFKYMNCMMRMLIRKSNMAPQFEDHDFVYEEAKEDGGVEWVIARPAMLKEGEKGKVKEWGTTGEGAGWMPSITRESVAGWLVDAAENEKGESRAVVITN